MSTLDLRTPSNKEECDNPHERCCLFESFFKNMERQLKRDSRRNPAFECDIENVAITNWDDSTYCFNFEFSVTHRLQIHSDD